MRELIIDYYLHQIFPTLFFNVSTDTNQLYLQTGSFSFKDMKSWLSGHLLTNAAKNSFSKLMEKLCVVMEVTPVDSRRSMTYVEKDSLVQRLARGLHKINAQTLEAGITDRTPATVGMISYIMEAFPLCRISKC